MTSSSSNTDERSSDLSDPGRHEPGQAVELRDDPTTRDHHAGIPAGWITRLLETGPQPFAMIDLQARFIEANQAFAELVGYSRDEILGMSVLDLTAPQSLDRTRQSHADVLSSGKNERVIKYYCRKDGGIVPVELILDVYRDEAGQPLGLYAFITDISERAKAEAALRLSEQRYRQLYDEAPVGYHEIDRELRIVNINRTACELLGYDPHELLSRSVLELIAPADRDRSALALREKLEGIRTLVPYEQVLVTREGRHLTAEIQERERRGDDGRIVGLRSVVQDISKRKETEAALVESERRARGLFDGIHDAVFVYDQEGRILDANPAACRQLGYSREELLGMTTSQIDSPESAAGFQERLQWQLQEGILTCEGLHRTKNGRIIPVEVTTSTIQFGNQVAVLAILRDITERKALERTRREFAAAQMRNAQEMELKNRALSDSEARYRQLAEGSLDAIVAADENGRITLFNPAAEKVFGYEGQVVLGRPLEQLIPGIVPSADVSGTGPRVQGQTEGTAAGTVPGATQPSSGEAKDSGSAFPPLAEGSAPPWFSPVAGKTVELEGRKRDGTEFPLELSLSAVEMDGHSQYIGSIRDQTERHRMRAMLAHTDKLASIGLLSAGVAHEMNNPLAYVLNNLVVLQREVKGLLDLVRLYESSRGSLAQADPVCLGKIEELEGEIDWPYVRDNLEAMIDRTRTGAKRVASIVEKLRGLARTSPPQWESISLAELVENTLEVMRGRLKHQRIEVVVNIHDVTRIQCVPDQIGQVLLNVLINALQAIESTGRQEGGRIEVDGRLQGPWVAISVCDNGPGIEPEHRGRLFDPFFTTKPVGEGTGLGLAISHGIVSGHGGRIEVESRLGEGTCFRILLPQHPNPSPLSPAISPIYPQPLA